MIELCCEYLSVRGIWLYVLIMLPTNESTLYIYLNVKELLAQNRHHIWSLNECKRTRTHNHLVRKRTLNYLAQLTKWLSCVVSTYCTRHLILCSYHVTYTFQSESSENSQLSSIICSVWLNGRVLVYEVSGCRFESGCSHLYGACFEQGVPWHSGKNKV